MKRSLLFLSLGLAASACGTKSGNGATASPTPVALALSSVEPSDLKANFNGDVFLHGSGFVATSYALINGQPASAIPSASSTFVDENTIKVHVTYAGAGAELPVGDLHVQVASGTQQSDEQVVHVRTILKTVDHVRTLPGYFVRNGGFLDIWAIPKDLAATFIGPGHELAGAAGLDDANFQWKNVKATRVGTTTTATPSISGVADVVLEPVGTTKPLAVAITIDQSGSMIGLGANPVPSDPNDERVNQSEAFVTRMSAVDRAEVIRFQGEAGAVFTVQPLTADKTLLKTGLEGLKTTEGGNTPLFDAMIKSVADIAAVPGNVTKAVIVLTDGRDTTSTQTEAQAIAAARAANIPIFSIGLGNPNDAASLDRASLQRIADQTGGRVFFAEDPTALAGIFDELTAILADSYRLECALSFNPPLTAAGTYKIEGTIETDVDGEHIEIPMPAFNVSVLN